MGSPLNCTIIGTLWRVRTRSIFSQVRAIQDSWQEFQAWFPDNDACRHYLERLRWPDGFVCPACGHKKAWRSSNHLWKCQECNRRTSVTAGTILDKTRTPLQLWFAAAWYITNQKLGVSALGLRRVLGFGSQQTAWTMLHKFRKAMVRTNRTQLAGNSTMLQRSPARTERPSGASLFRDWCVRHGW